MKIWQRGALLILLPLLCEVAGIALLVNALVENSQSLEEARKQSLLLQEMNQTLVLFVQSSGSLISYYTSGRDDFRQATQEFLTQTEAHLESEKKMVAGDKVLLDLIDQTTQEALAPLKQVATERKEVERGLAAVAQTVRKLKPALRQANKANLLCMQMIDRQRQKNEITIQKQRRSLQHVYVLLVGLAIVNVGGALVALSFFHASISSRVITLMAKARKLPKLEDFGARMSGKDEFAELDTTLHDAFERLVSANEFKQSLVSMIVHDLRSPLTSIGITADMMSELNKEELSSKSLQKLQSIKKTSDRLLGMVDEFLDLAKLQSGELKLNKQRVQASTIIDEAFQTLEEIAAFKKLSLKQDCPELELNIDKQKTLQVLINLLSNAIKFSPRNSEILVNVELCSSDLAKFRVIDKGPGLSPETQKNLFSKFSQASTADAIGIKGSGLGLFISKWFIDGQGGELSFENAAGGGSIFWFTLPVSKENGNADLIAASKNSPHPEHSESSS